MPYEIMGKFHRDEDEYYRTCGDSELEAVERSRPPAPRKPDPFTDVSLPKRDLPKKPSPF